MNCRKTWPPFLLALSLAPCVAYGLAGETRPPEQPKAPRVYTNDDLERVRPFRDELGARSLPAVPSGAGRAAGEAASSRRAATASGAHRDHDEAYWRREAEKLRERLRTLADQRDALRARIAEGRDEEQRVLRRGRNSRASGIESRRTLEARIAAIERRMRDLEEDLAERARRAGALPGWLR